MANREEEVREANAKIAELLKEVQDKLDEATKIADAAQVEFTFNGPRSSYGFGGWYSPTRPQDRDDWADSNQSLYEDDWYESGWRSSSESC